MESATEGSQGRGQGRRVRNLRLVHKRSDAAAATFGAIPLKPGVMYVGRVPTNDIQLPSELVSRRHAKLIFTDMGLTLHDLDSHNGVFVNGKKVRSTPVEVGDFVYFADVCCQVEVAEGSETQDAFDVESSMNKSNLLSQVLKGEGGDDPAVRNLATLIQATELLLSADDETFYPEMVSRCRDLTEATVGVFIRRGEGGELETPVILREGTAPRGEAPVSWAVVRKSIDESCVLFSKDTAADPLVPGELLASGDAGAVMCVPVLVAGEARAAIYLMRPFAGEGFTDKEVETVSAVAHLIGVRMRGAGLRLAGEHGGVEATSVRKPGHSTSEEDEQRSLEQESEVHRRVAELEALVLSKTSTAEEAQRRVRELDDKLAEQRARLEDQLTQMRAELEKRSAAGTDSSRKLHELEARLEAQNAEVAAARNDGAAAREELAKSQREVGRRSEEVQRAAEQLARLTQELEAERVRAAEEAQQLRAEMAAAKEAAESAKSAISPEALVKATSSLGPRVARRVQMLAAGQEPGDDLGAGLVTALCLGLSGLDAWAQSVSADEASARVDGFCRAVADAAARHDGTLEQVMGHAHLLTFPGDAKGVRGALGCAYEVLQVVGQDAQTGVQGGLHVAPAVLGFFGGERAVYTQFGEAVAIARGACEYARPGSVFVTDKVRSVVGDDPRVVFIFAGPHLIRGFMTPFDLFQLGMAPGAAGS